jgi:hypothetical protein
MEEMGCIWNCNWDVVIWNWECGEVGGNRESVGGFEGMDLSIDGRQDSQFQRGL